MRSPIGLKLSGDLGLVSQISVHVLVSKFDYFLYCKQTKEQQKRRNRENHGFTKLAFSPPCRVRLIWNLVGTSGQVLEIVWYVCFVYIIVCLHFVNMNKENTLYGFLGRLSIKCFETWFMSSPVPNLQFCRARFWIHRLFMFYGYKQTSRFGAILRKRSKVINMSIKWKV
jgi:hypothetical protein